MSIEARYFSCEVLETKAGGGEPKSLKAMKVVTPKRTGWVTELSHGWRAFVLKPGREYEEVKCVPTEPEFETRLAILGALGADVALQIHGPKIRERLNADLKT